jgi:hypothetical protein
MGASVCGFAAGCAAWLCLAALSASLDNTGRIIRINAAQSGSSSVVEHRLAKARVASSNLVSRSTNFGDEGGLMKLEHFIFPPLSFILTARRRSQVVRQRSAKPLFIGSIPIAASNHNLNH